MKLFGVTVMDGMSRELLSLPVSLCVCECYLTVLKCTQSTTKCPERKGFCQLSVISGASKTVCRELGFPTKIRCGIKVAMTSCYEIGR